MEPIGDHGFLFSWIVDGWGDGFDEFCQVDGIWSSELALISRLLTGVPLPVDGKHALPPKWHIEHEGIAGEYMSRGYGL